MIHLIKLSVGSESVDTLAAWQSQNAREYHGALAVPHRTRHKPKRDMELIRDGSIYWVINRKIQARQKILGFEEWTDPDGIKHCLIMNDATLIRTVAYPHRPFQGWRYLDPAKAPADRGVFVAGEEEEPPEDLAAELRAAGLID